jgi:hypothetical protein
VRASDYHLFTCQDIARSPESGGSASVQDHQFSINIPNFTSSAGDPDLGALAEAPQTPENLVLTNWFTAMCTTTSPPLASTAIFQIVCASNLT